MSQDQDDRPTLPFPLLASIVPPPAALVGPLPAPQLELELVLPLDNPEPESFEIPGVVDPAPAPPPPPPTKRATNLKYAALDPIPGLMNARETHMLSGSSGAGKTSWLGWFVAQLLSADTIFDRPIQKPPVIVYLSGDRSLRDAEEKFIKAGWLEPNVWGIVESTNQNVETHLKGTADGSANTSQAFPIFRHALEEIARANKYPSGVLPPDSLVIIDSMSTILGIEPSGSYLRNVAAPLALLNRFCRQAKITVLLVHHGGKQMADKTQRYARAQDRILGSMALLGFTSTQFQLTEPELTERPEDGVYELTVVSHAAKPFAAGFTRDLDDGKFTPLTGSLPLPEKREDQTTLVAELQPQRVEPRPTKLAKSHQGILSALRVDAADAKLSGLDGRWCQTTALRAYLESLCSKAAFYKALEKLGTIGMIEAKLEDGIAWVRLAQGESKQAS